MKHLFPVRISTIRANDKAPFDIFVQLSHRFVHYCSKGDEVEEERLRNLKKHGVRKLFIQPEHEELYLQYLEIGLNDLKNNQLSLGDRSALAHDSLLTTAEQAVGNISTQEKYNGEQRRFDKVATFITSEKSAVKEIVNMAGLYQQLNEHAAVVSSLSVALAGKKGIEDKQVIFELGMAGLLHDIGKTKLNWNHMKPESEMTAEELRQLRNHPQDGVDMLADKPFISSRILHLIASHEERGVGQGYPNQIDLFKEELPLQILSLVNCFDHFSRQNMMSHFKSLDPFFERYGQDYDLQLFTELGTVLS